MPELDGKKYSYDDKGKAAYKKDLKKLKQRRKDKPKPKAKSKSKTKATTSNDKNNYRTKYGDYDPHDVQEGTVNYGGTDYSEELGSAQLQYSIATKQGEGKDYYRWSNKLYRITNDFGTTYEEVIY